MLTEIHVPEDATSAAALIANGGTALAGGTSLMPRLNDYASPPTELVSLRRAGLADISIDGSAVRIGAAATLAQVEDDERLALLSPVVRSIASVPVRNLATVGGNLFAIQPYGDLTVALVALGAKVEFAGEPAAAALDQVGGDPVSVEQLATSDQASRRLVTAIQFSLPAQREFRYLKATRRRFNSGSIVTVAATIAESEGVIAQARIAFGGVGPSVIRAKATEAALLGKPLDAESIATAAEAGLGEIAPADDAYASAWYRARVFPVHLRRALLGH